MDEENTDARKRAESTGRAAAMVLTTSCHRLGCDAGIMILVREGVACTAVHVNPQSQAAQGLGYWSSTLAGELRELADSLERDLHEQHSPRN